jgi:hypothetical protein
MTILTVPNEFKFDSQKALNNFSTHVYKIMLMDDTFVFDKDTDGTVADVSANEISSTGGYARQTLSVDVAWAQDNTNDKGSISWDNVTFTASGADFDDFESAIIYNDTHASDLIVGHIDFEATISLANGNSFQMQSLGFDAS